MLSSAGIRHTLAIDTSLVVLTEHTGTGRLALSGLADFTCVAGDCSTRIGRALSIDTQLTLLTVR